MLANTYGLYGTPGKARYEESSRTCDLAVLEDMSTIPYMYQKFFCGVSECMCVICVCVRGGVWCGWISPRSSSLCPLSSTVTRPFCLHSPSSPQSTPVASLPLLLSSSPSPLSQTSPLPSPPFACPFLWFQLFRVLSSPLLPSLQL